MGVLSRPTRDQLKRCRRCDLAGESFGLAVDGAQEETNAKAREELPGGVGKEGAVGECQCRCKPRYIDLDLPDVVHMLVDLGCLSQENGWAYPLQ